ncbi:class I SAM-dependent methyltransferase [Pseudomonadota bacterium]
MRGSIYHNIDKANVRREYAQASTAENDFERAKWGSHESMINRFHLAEHLVDWASVGDWLDVGCGAGLMFETVEGAGRAFKRLVGVDITAEVLSFASTRKLQSPAEFYVLDLEAMPQDFYGAFDLVSMIGVLQQCGNLPAPVLAAVSSAVRPGGQLFLTTKNLGWKAFLEEGFEPEAGHSWFVYDELVDILHNVGMEIVQAGGFLPQENKIVDMDASHTLYILARKVEDQEVE